MVIQGIVVPCEWDKKGSVTGIAIAGYDEEVTPVLMDINGKKMISLLHKKVMASGSMVTIDNTEFMMINIFDEEKKLQTD